MLMLTSLSFKCHYLLLNYHKFNYHTIVIVNMNDDMRLYSPLLNTTEA
jgi:hypothetical protein